MPNQTALTTTAVDIQADGYETPKAEGEELMATLRLVPVRVLVTDEISALPCVPNFADPKLGQLLRLQEADYQDAIDQLATEHEQRRRALPNQTVPVATATDIPTAGAAVALVLVVDSTQCLADIELLAQAANRSLQVRHHLFNLCQPSLELAGLDLEVVPTANASECGIRFQLPHAFRQLALALRAGEFDAL